MARASCFVILALLAGAAAQEVTPMEKVIQLIEGLHAEVEKEGKAEAAAYDEFACFCKEKTAGKSSSITSEHDTIEKESASVESTSAEKGEASDELASRKSDSEAMSLDLTKTQTRCAKAQAEYEATAADLHKAISSLHNAEAAMSASKADSAPADLMLIQNSGHDDLVSTLSLADAMGLLKSKKHKAISSMLQGSKVDPEDPEYKYHSNEIVETLQNLAKDFEEKKGQADEDWKREKTSCEELKSSISGKITETADTMHSIETHIDEMSAEVAEDKGEIVEEESDLEDDEEYLKDLTMRCESRAKEWDQRSQVRNDELIVLEHVLETLTGKVAEADEKANKRALLQKESKQTVKAVKAPAKKHVALLQRETKEVSKEVSKGFLAKYDNKERVLALITSAGAKLGSTRLINLARRAQLDTSADPFKKMKKLMQDLIERLTEEARAEATKKGFCDTELGKAEVDRSHRHSDTMKLNSKIERLEAKKDALSEEITILTEKLGEERETLKEATEDRTRTKESNLETIKTAKQGLKDLEEATTILKNFYKSAAKSEVAFVQESPVAADEPDAGFSGGYKGKQSGTKAVFALLETISSDFDRTIRTTTADEDKDAKDFVVFQRTSKVALKEMETKKLLNEQDLETTKGSLEESMSGLSKAMDLLDASLKATEALKPMCIDNGQSFEERTKKREQEMEALESALRMLSSEDSLK